jgi:hypothetical protein
MFVTKFQGNITFGYTFFMKKKKKFIPLPWKVGDFVFRSINKIDEFANHFHNLNLKYAEKIRGFDPNWNICGTHVNCGF